MMIFTNENTKISERQGRSIDKDQIGSMEKKNWKVIFNMTAHHKNDSSKAHRETKDKDVLKFLTCGSVDDGKSTLLGRLIYGSANVYADQLESATQESRIYGTTEDKLDFALLLDGLQAERERGVTIDVAYRFFETEKRKFIAADAPGHEQYTRNMVTAASNCEAAIVLVDATKGVINKPKGTASLRHCLSACHFSDQQNGSGQF